MAGSGTSVIVTLKSADAGIVPEVVIVTDQPREMLPSSSTASSTTNSDHAPFGFDPLNVARVESNGVGGAGEGNKSPIRKFVGLFVPETICPESGRLVAAASSNLSVTFVITLPPPQSLISPIRWSAGPASKISISSGFRCDTFVNVTVTLLTVPGNPATAMVLGYGVAGSDVPLFVGLLIVIGVVLLNVPLAVPT